MKYIFISFIAILISGCFPNDVQIAQAKFACKDKGGLFETSYDVRLDAICNNGERIKRVTDILITDPSFYFKEGSKNEQ